jgi:hypothetical protein
MTQFVVWNSAMPTTAARTPVTTGTSIKTMLQVLHSTRAMRVVRWGVRFSSAPTAVVSCELLETGTVAATVTAHVAAGVQPYSAGETTPASGVTLSTSGTGYTSTAEGSITATRTGDEWIAPIGVSQYDYEWSLGREFVVPPTRVLRIRMTTATAVSANCYIVYDE